MPFSQTPAIRAELAARPEYRSLAEAASPVVAEAIGPPAARVSAEWGLRHDERGRPLITLTIRDWAESVSTDFAPGELNPPEKSWRRFYRLWGDLLQRAAHALIGASDQPVPIETN